MATTTDIKPKAPYALCHKCPLADRPFASTTGPEDASVAVVSRSPGYFEGLAGKSFSGPSGKVLDHLLQLHGVSRKDVLATNAVLCQSDGTEEGFAKAIECCAPRLHSEIGECDTVIAAGREAAWSIAGESNISQNRGYVHNVSNAASDKEQRVIITNNPAVVLRDDRTFPELVRDFRLALDPLPTPAMPKVRIIDDVEEAFDVAEKVIESIESGTLVAADIETRGRNGQTGLSHTSELVCLGISTRPERALVFGERPCVHDEWKTRFLGGLLAREDVRYLGHNFKYDVKILRTMGVNARVDEDTMLLSYALDERPGDPESGAGGHSLEWLLKDELGWSKYEPSSVRHFKKTGEFLADPTGSTKRSKLDLYQYNGYDTAGCLGLYQVLAARAKNDNVFDRPYKLILLRLSEALARIELEGIAYDSEAACNILESAVYPKLQEYHISAQALVKPHRASINLNSPKQTGELLYDDWGLVHKLQRPKVERQGKRSSDQYVREEILRGDFVVDETVVNRRTVELFTKVFDDFKSLDKQRSNYLEGLILRATNNNGRLYTDFKIHGTESGRLSSSKPNLQNITRPKEGLPNIRTPFIPDPGCVFVSADLSQAELRTIAYLSGDTSLQSIYLDTNRSLHKEVAAKFYGEDYTYEQYVRAKNINFGVAYWQSAYSFAQLYHMPQKEAQEYIDFWWDRFPQVKEWTHSIERECLEVGEIQSPFGHKRRCYVIPADESARLHVVKQFINFKPQNIAANLTNWALCDFVDWLIESDNWQHCQPRITVHDSILINVKRKYAEEMGAKLVEFMQAAPKVALDWTFPFISELSIGETWGTMKELTI
jgi:uracil-DNA glycosylase family 4